MSIQTNSPELIKAIDKFVNVTRRDVAKVTKDQAGLLVRDIINITPPAFAKTTGTAAKRALQEKIQSDLGRLFRPTTRRRAESTDIAGIHKANRNARGSVKKRVTQVAVPSADLKQYQKLLVSRIGFLAAGWLSALHQLGRKAPAWIERHRAPGAASVRINSRGVEVRMTNKVKYASRWIEAQRRIQYAIKYRTNAINRQIEAILNKNKP